MTMKERMFIAERRMQLKKLKYVLPESERAMFEKVTKAQVEALTEMTRDYNVPRELIDTLLWAVLQETALIEKAKPILKKRQKAIR